MINLQNPVNNFVRGRERSWESLGSIHNDKHDQYKLPNAQKKCFWKIVCFSVISSGFWFWSPLKTELQTGIEHHFGRRSNETSHKKWWKKYNFVKSIFLCIRKYILIMFIMVDTPETLPASPATAHKIVDSTGQLSAFIQRDIVLISYEFLKIFDFVVVFERL